MPIYVYRVKHPKEGCPYCTDTFELLQQVGEAPVSRCPQCKAAVEKIYAPFSHGASKTGLDRRAKEKGFHKLKKVDKGKYEKLY